MDTGEEERGGEVVTDGNVGGALEETLAGKLAVADDARARNVEGDVSPLCHEKIPALQGSEPIKAVEDVGNQTRGGASAPSRGGEDRKQPPDEEAPTTSTPAPLQEAEPVQEVVKPAPPKVRRRDQNGVLLPLEFPSIEQFAVGDMVWAKSGRKAEPFWPAVVADPCFAPEAVKKFIVSDQLLAMFFGPPASKTRERDYAFLKRGQVLAFDEHIECQYQTIPRSSRPVAFRKALEEALQWEKGGYVDLYTVHNKDKGDDIVVNPAGDGSDMACTSCGILIIPPATKHAGGRCRSCNKIHKEGQYCRVCDKVWLPTSKDMVCCDKCGNWVHSTCDALAKEAMNGPEEDEYFCPKCRSKSKTKSDIGTGPGRGKGPPKLLNSYQLFYRDFMPEFVKKNPHVNQLQEKAGHASAAWKELDKKSREKYEKEARAVRKEYMAYQRAHGDRAETCPVVQEKQKTESVQVVLKGTTGTFRTHDSTIVCHCEKCRKISLARQKAFPPNKWETHLGLGSRGRWRQNIKIAGNDDDAMSLGEWLDVTENDRSGRPPPPWLAFRDQSFEGVEARWMTDRCAVCDEDKDTDADQFLTCAKCNVTVHQNCYGVDRLPGAGQVWHCRACELGSYDDVKPRCCLCPLEGGALKPATIPGLWVHVNCTTWIPEVCVKDEKKMEPVERIHKISAARWDLTCVLCRRKMGAKIQCSTNGCFTAYHPLCAKMAGYHQEMKLGENDELELISYCARHCKPRLNKALSSACQHPDLVREMGKRMRGDEDGNDPLGVIKKQSASRCMPMNEWQRCTHGKGVATPAKISHPLAESLPKGSTVVNGRAKREIFSDSHDEMAEPMAGEEKNVILPSAEPAIVETKAAVAHQTPSQPDPLLPKSLQRALAIHDLDAVIEAAPSEYIGCRVEIYWDGDDTWYTGTIRSYHKKKKHHGIQYDDGEYDSLNLSKEQFRWITRPRVKRKRAPAVQAPQPVALQEKNVEISTDRIVGDEIVENVPEEPAVEAPQFVGICVGGIYGDFLTHEYKVRCYCASCAKKESGSSLIKPANWEWHLGLQPSASWSDRITVTREGAATNKSIGEWLSEFKIVETKPDFILPAFEEMDAKGGKSSWKTSYLASMLKKRSYIQTLPAVIRGFRPKDRLPPVSKAWDPADWYEMAKPEPNLNVASFVPPTTAVVDQANLRPPSTSEAKGSLGNWYDKKCVSVPGAASSRTSHPNYAWNRLKSILKEALRRQLLAPSLKVTINSKEGLMDLNDFSVVCQCEECRSMSQKGDMGETVEGYVAGRGLVMKPNSFALHGGTPQWRSGRWREYIFVSESDSPNQSDGPQTKKVQVGEWIKSHAESNDWAEVRSAVDQNEAKHEMARERKAKRLQQESDAPGATPPKKIKKQEKVESAHETSVVVKSEALGIEREIGPGLGLQNETQANQSLEMKATPQPAHAYGPALAEMANIAATGMAENREAPTPEQQTFMLQQAMMQQAMLMAQNFQLNPVLASAMAAKMANGFPFGPVDGETMKNFWLWQQSLQQWQQNALAMTQLASGAAQGNGSHELPVAVKREEEPRVISSTVHTTPKKAAAAAAAAAAVAAAAPPPPQSQTQTQTQGGAGTSIGTEKVKNEMSNLIKEPEPEYKLLVSLYIRKNQTVSLRLRKGASLVKVVKRDKKPPAEKRVRKTADTKTTPLKRKATKELAKENREATDRYFKAMQDRLTRMQETERERLAFGKSAIQGWGLIAQKSYNEGDFVVEYRGQVVRNSVANLLEDKYRKQGKACYLFAIDENFVVDATNCGNLGRFINHSCNPNMHTKVVDVSNSFRIIFVARRDIAIGEELSFDYRFEKDSEKGAERIPCFCGAPTCRGYMN